MAKEHKGRVFATVNDELDIIERTIAEYRRFADRRLHPTEYLMLLERALQRARAAWSPVGDRPTHHMTNALREIAGLAIHALIENGFRPRFTENISRLVEEITVPEQATAPVVDSGDEKSGFRFFVGDKEILEDSDGWIHLVLQRDPAKELEIVEWVLLEPDTPFTVAPRMTLPPYIVSLLGLTTLEGNAHGVTYSLGVSVWKFQLEAIMNAVGGRIVQIGSKY